MTSSSERERDLVEALKAANAAIEALIHSEQNPHSYRLERVAGDAVANARRLTRAALTEETP